MVGTYKELTIKELGELVGLLAQYKDNLVYLAQEGEIMDEDPHDRDERDIAIVNVTNCLGTVTEELKYRLTEY